MNHPGRTVCPITLLSPSPTGLWEVIRPFWWKEEPGLRSSPLQADKKGCGGAFRKGCVCNKAVLSLNDRSHLVLFRAGVINAARDGRGRNGDLGEKSFLGLEIERMWQMWGSCFDVDLMQLVCKTEKFYFSLEDPKRLCQSDWTI